MIKKFKTGDCITNECCDCGSRHLWLFKIIRGKTPQDDVVEMQIFLEKPTIEERTQTNKPKTDNAEKEERKVKVISAVGAFLSRTSAQPQKAKQRKKGTMLF
jgi:hypothetical protein